MRHVGARLGLGERLQVVARGHTLGELAQVLAGQHLAQLGLADEDDLQELLARGLEVRQQADLLQHLAAEVLRLVDHQHGAAPARVRVQQVAVEGVDQRLEAGGARGIDHVQLVADRGQQLDGREGGIEHHGHVDRRRELLEQRAAERGLAGSHLARELHEAAAALAQPPQQVGQRLAVAVGEVEIARVRRDRERLLGEPEV